MLIKPKIYKLKSGRYQVSYHNPAIGKRIRRKFASHAEADGFVEDLHSKFLVFQSYSSAESVEIWMSRYLQMKPDAFIVKQGNPLMKSFLNTFGHIPVMSVSQEAVSGWLVSFQNERKLSVKTMPNVRSAINQFFQFIVDSKALADNPVTFVSPVAGLPPKERIVLTENEIEEILNLLKSASPDLIYPVVVLLARTGARLDEILTLKWKDVHFELGAIQLLWTKNGEDRLIHVSDEVMSFLNTLKNNAEYVVLSQYGAAWTHSIFRKQFNKIRQKIGYRKYWCNHALRHSYATNYLKSGGDMLKLQKLLGHKTLQMTVDLYGQIKASDVQDISPFKF